MAPRELTVAIVGGGLAGLDRLRHAAPRRCSRRTRSPSSATAQIRRRRGASARGRSASAACARRATATSRRRRSPGSPCARRGGGSRSRRSRAASAAATTRASTSSSSTSRTSVPARAGTTASVQARVGARSARVPGGFELDLVAQSHKLRRGVFRHVLVASGHPGLAFPDELAGDPRAVHAYAPHEYADDVEVVGAGMAAATEWLNALAAGARVVSVRRREPERRPLNLPRSLFTRRGLAAYHRTQREERLGLLRRFSAPSYPAGPRVGRADRGRGPRGTLPRCRRAQRRGAGHLRDGLQARVRAGSAAAPARRRARRRDGRGLDRPRAGLHGAGAHG